MTVPELPDCAHCDANQTLERINGTDVGDAYYVCSCCGQTTRIDAKNRAHQIERRTDVNGTLMDDEY